MASVSELAKRRFEGRKLLEDMAKERRACMRDITGRYNYPFLVEIRRDFCIRAKGLGLGCVMIGKILHRSPWTVLYHLKPEMRVRKREQRLRWAAANPQVRAVPQGETHIGAG